eukprot:3736995-Amphidinium_carterae.1
MEAVVLFTSGSESVPKGVPLTHGNVLTNVEGMMAVAEAKDCVLVRDLFLVLCARYLFLTKDSDCMFGALPPFHSFGFTVTTCGPMVTGLKAAFYPNPTEYRRIARAWLRTRCLCGMSVVLLGQRGNVRSAEVRLRGGVPRSTWALRPLSMGHCKLQRLQLAVSRGTARHHFLSVPL